MLLEVGQPLEDLLILAYVLFRGLAVVEMNQHVSEGRVQFFLFLLN